MKRESEKGMEFERLVGLQGFAVEAPLKVSESKPKMVFEIEDVILNAEMHDCFYMFDSRNAPGETDEAESKDLSSDLCQSSFFILGSDPSTNNNIDKSSEQGIMTSPCVDITQSNRS